MGQTRPPIPALLITAISSNRVEAIEWGAEQIEAAWGEVWLKTPIFDFDHTSFYNQTMGDGIKKQLFAFEQPIDPGKLCLLYTSPSPRDS